MHPARLQVLESGGEEQGVVVGSRERLVDEPVIRRRARRGSEPEPIHGAISPADVRPGDPVFAQVRLADHSERQLPSRVWRISPMGIELVRPQELPAILAGTPVDLTVRIGANVSTFRGLPVVATAAEHGHELLGLRWRPPPRGQRAQQPRATSRWSCQPEYAPTGIAPSAVRYEDYVYFRVVDISRHGMQLETSLRNKYLVPGVELESTTTFPTQGQLRLRLRVVHTRIVERDDKQHLAVGVTFVARDAAAMETIGQYLLRFGVGATIRSLSGEGFRVPCSSRALDFGCVRSSQDYRDVLRLRRLAYVHAKKVSADAKDVDLGDHFDACSRILYARHHGEVVATARLMYPQTSADPLKHEEFLELPPLPARDQLVEVSKAATHPGYRGSDLFYTLLMHVGLIILQSGRRYALMSATDSLAPVYERFGFRRTGASYEHPSMRLRHHLMLLDVAHVVAGVGIGPIFWNLVGGWELWNYGKLCGIVATDRWTTARVHLWHALRPLSRLARMLYERRLRKRGLAT